MSQEDPHWLKSRADDFFKSGDALSAISAFTAALDIDENFTACYANRAACYFKLENFTECLADCNKALELLADDTSEDACRMKNKLLRRRALSFCQLANYTDAVRDFETLLELLPLNSADQANIQSDIQHFKLLATAEQIKFEGDMAFANQRIADAAEKFQEALALVPVHIGCLSNLSACRLATGDFEGCISACSDALSLLEVNTDASLPSAAATITTSTTSVQRDALLASILPKAGSEKRKQWVLKTIVRRGVAYVKVNKLGEAIEDYKIAVSLDPANQDLRVDLNRLIKFRESRQQQESQK